MENEKLKEEIKAELKKEMTSETKKQNNKKNNNSFVALLVAIIVLLSGYIIYTDFIMKPTNETNKQQNTETKEETKTPIKVTKSIQNELKNILGITSWIDDGLPSSDFYTIILEDTGVINQLSKEKKQSLINEYILMNNLYTKVDGQSYEWCIAGKGYCEGVSSEQYKKAASKFGITDAYDDIFGGYQKYNNLYLLNNGGYTVGNKISHNLVFNSTDTTIEVTDNYVLTSYNDGNVVKRVKRTYTFKKNDLGYYLYSMK